MDPYECAICLSNMLNRTPRSLSCLHSFCTECLKELVEDSKVHCPMCRKVTVLESKDITELTVNFLLSQMKDRETRTPKLAPVGDQENKSPCQICKMEVSGYYCHQCRQLLCLKCKTKHSTVGAFRFHEVADLCHLHTDSHVTHICMQCVQPMCNQCILLKHINHQDYLVTYNEGIKKLQQKAQTVYKNAKAKITNTDEEFEAKDRIDVELEETAKTLEDQEAFHEAKLKEAGRLLAEVKKKIMKSDNLQKAYEDGRMECHLAAGSVHTLITNTDTDGFCDKYTKIINKAQQAVENLDKLSMSDLLLEFVAQKPCDCDTVKPKVSKRAVSTESATVQMRESEMDKARKSITFKQRESETVEVRPFETDKARKLEIVKSELAKEQRKTVAQKLPKVEKVMDMKLSKLVLHMKQTVDIKWGCQAAILGNNVLFVNSTTPNHVIRLNTEGTVIGCYYPAGDGDIFGVAVHDNRIYIAQRQSITVLPTIEGEWTQLYHPEADNINKVLVKDKSTIFITNDKAMPDGKIYKYKVDEDITEVVVQGLNYPCYMNVIDGPECMYIVGSTDKVWVYDEHFRLLHRLEGRGSRGSMFCEIHALAITPMNTLLVTDKRNHRVSHYTLDGRMMSHVLTKKDGVQNPVAIAYNKPYLWVASIECKYMKCFLLE